MTPALIFFVWIQNPLYLFQWISFQGLDVISIITDLLRLAGWWPIDLRSHRSTLSKETLAWARVYWYSGSVCKGCFGDQRVCGFTVWQTGWGGCSVFCLNGLDEMRAKINQGAHMPSYDPLVWQPSKTGMCTTEGSERQRALKTKSIGCNPGWYVWAYRTCCSIPLIISSNITE